MTNHFQTRFPRRTCVEEIVCPRANSTLFNYGACSQMVLANPRTLACSNPPHELSHLRCFPVPCPIHRVSVAISAVEKVAECELFQRKTNSPPPGFLCQQSVVTLTLRLRSILQTPTSDQRILPFRQSKILTASEFLSRRILLADNVHRAETRRLRGFPSALVNLSCWRT